MKNVLKWSAIGFGGFIVLVIIIGIIAGEPKETGTPAATAVETPNPEPTLTPNLIAQYVDSLLLINDSVTNAMSEIANLSSSPAYTNSLWRDRMATHAQTLIVAEQTARKLSPPDKLQDAHEAFLMGLDLYSQAGSLIQSAMIAFGSGDIATGTRLINAVASTVTEGAAHIGFATILLRELSEEKTPTLTATPGPTPTPTPTPKPTATPTPEPTDPYAAIRAAALSAVMQMYEAEFQEENRRLAATFGRSGDPERIGSVVGVVSGGVCGCDVAVHYQTEGLQIVRMSRVVLDGQTMRVDGPVTTFIGSGPASDALSLKPIAEAQGPDTLVKLYGVELGHEYSDPADSWKNLKVWAKVTNTGSKPIDLSTFSFVVVQGSFWAGTNLIVPVMLRGAYVGGLIEAALTDSEIEQYGIGRLDRIGFEVVIMLNPGYSLDLLAILPYDSNLTPDTYLRLAGARFPFPRSSDPQGSG